MIRFNLLHHQAVPEIELPAAVHVLHPACCSFPPLFRLSRGAHGQVNCINFRAVSLPKLYTYLKQLQLQLPVLISKYIVIPHKSLLMFCSQVQSLLCTLEIAEVSETSLIEKEGN